MKTRNAVIILALVLASAFPAPVKAQRVRVRVTEIGRPLSVLRELPLIGKFFPKPVEAPKFPSQPPRYPMTPSERQEIERIMGPRPMPLTRYGLPGPYTRRSSVDLLDPNLPPETAWWFKIRTSNGRIEIIPTEPTGPSFTPKQIAGFQLTLKRLGYDIKVDGRNGPQTSAAVAALQEANGYRSVSGNLATLIRRPDGSLGDVKYADGELDEDTVSYLNLIADLRSTARKIYLMDPNARTNALDRSKTIKGYAEYDDHFDIYYTATPNGLTFKKSFGNRDFGILRYYPKNQGFDIEVIDPVEADNEFLAYCKSELSKYSTQSVVFVTAIKTATGYRMLGPGNHVIDFDARDIRNLRAGKPLSKQNILADALSKFSGNLVVWRNPLMKKSSGELRLVEQLAFGLQRAYPEITVSRTGPDPQKTGERIKALNNYTIRSADDVLVVLDATSRVTDYKIVDNLRPLLTDAKIPIVEYTPGVKMTKGKDKAVIVITGHINKKLNDLIDELCKDGYFAGNYVFLNSCNDPKGIGTKLIDKLLANCGAQAVMRYQGLITVGVVETFLTRMAESVKSGTPFTLHDLQLKSITGKTSGIFVAHNLRRVNVENEANQVQ